MNFRNMAEKLLRGHHIKNLSLALSPSGKDIYNKTNCAYILDSDPKDLVRIVAGEKDGFCESCQRNYFERYAKCQKPTEMPEYDTDLAKLWGFEIGEVYSAEDLISRLRPTRTRFVGIVKTTAYLCKLIFKEIVKS